MQEGNWKLCPVTMCSAALLSLSLGLSPLPHTALQMGQRTGAFVGCTHTACRIGSTTHPISVKSLFHQMVCRVQHDRRVRGLVQRGHREKIEAWTWCRVVCANKGCCTKGKLDKRKRVSLIVYTQSPPHILRCDHTC